MSRNLRLEEATRRKRQRKMQLIAICTIIVIGILSAVFYDLYRHSQTRIYSDGDQTVTLNPDGSFTARLAHSNPSGRFTETADGAAAITFIYEGREVTGWIIDDALLLPDEWDDGHGHGDLLPRVRK